MRILLSAPALIISATCAFAQTSPQQTTEWGKEDVRLQTPITIRETAIPLSELAARLSDVTHAKITTRPSAADDKVSVFVKDYPAHKLMANIAQITGFTWELEDTRAKPSERAYEIYASRDLLSQEGKRRLQDYRAAIGKLADQLDQQAQTAGEERRGSVSMGDATYRVGNYAGVVATLFRSLTPPQVEALERGEPVTFSNKPSAAALPFPDEIEDPLKSAIDGDTAALSELRVRLLQTVRPAKRLSLDGVILFIASESSSASLGMDFGEVELSARHAVEERSEVENAISRLGLDKLPHRPFPGDAIVGTTDDFLRLLADSLDVNIVADSFLRADSGKLSGTTAELLLHYAEQSNSKLDGEAGLVLFSSRDRAWDRWMEIPARYWRAWQEAEQKNKAIGLKELIQAAELTVWQKPGFIQNGPLAGLKSLDGYHLGPPDWAVLSGLSKMAPQHRTLLLSGKEIPFDGISGLAKELLAAAVGERMRSGGAKDLAGTVVSLGGDTMHELAYTTNEQSMVLAGGNPEEMRKRMLEMHPDLDTSRLKEYIRPVVTIRFTRGEEEVARYMLRLPSRARENSGGTSSS